MKYFCAIFAIIIAISCIVLSIFTPSGGFAEISLNVLGWIIGGLGGILIFMLTLDD